MVQPISKPVKLTVWLALLFVQPVFAQTTVRDRIAAVEKGLTRNEPVAPGTILPTFDIRERMLVHHVNGAGIAVISEGRIEWSKSYGLKDARNPADSITRHTLFQLGSIGKLITALTALHLVREHRLELDEDVNQKLISWKVPENTFTAGHPVTLRSLLTHSAGLTDDYGFAGYEPHSVLPTTTQILNAERPANNRKKLSPQTVPGSVEKYSGGGYIIIQQLIEDVTKLPFNDYADSIIIRKLNLAHTTYDYYPDAHGQPIARGHDGQGKPDPKKPYHIYPEMAAAGPWTTPEDVARLLIEIQQEAAGSSDLILDEALARTMLSPQINSMGLGPHLAGAEKPLAFWHAGNTEGYTALVYGLTGTGQGAVIMTNSDQGEWLALELMRSIANTYHWPVMQNKAIRAMDDAELNRLTGSYGTDKATFTVARNKGALTLNNEKQHLTLVPLADGSFTISGAEDKCRLNFEVKGAPEVVYLHILQNSGKGNLTLTRTAP